jgi:hypothetical protein
MMVVIGNRDDLGVLVITADPIPGHFSRQATAGHFNPKEKISV